MSRNMPENVFVSYARSAEHSLIKKLKKWLKDTEEKKWEIVYDEDRLEPGGIIRVLEEEIGGADSIIIFLSKEYFHSIHCLRELMYMYEKGAGRLLPVIVFVGGSTPADIQESEITGYWEKEDPENEIIQKCSLMLAWLLGPYDEVTNNYDTLFVLLKDSEEHICSKVFTALKQRRKPHYTYISQRERQKKIKDKIACLLQNVPESDTKIIADKLGCVDNTKDLTERFSSASSTTEINNILCVFDDWLQTKAQFAARSDELKRLGSVAKEMLGWFLLTVLDDNKLHILTHELNRMGDSAFLELTMDTDASFQVLASAIFCSPVIFLLKKNVTIQRDS